MIIFNKEERDAFRPKKRESPSKYIEANRKLPEDSAEKGYYRFERAEYMRGIVDSVNENGVEEVVMLKSARAGFSVAVHSLLKYWAENYPGPAMIVLPTQAAAEEILNHSIRPMFANSLMTTDSKSDNTKIELILKNGMRITLGWATSETSLSMRNVKYLLLDEIDRFKKPGAITQARKRAETFRYRRRVLLGSTPTNQYSKILAEFNSCGDRRHYYVNCPHCRKLQTLEWENIKWDNPDNLEDDDELANSITQNPTRVYYRCKYCKEKVGEHHKLNMVQRGIWVSESQNIINNEVNGERTRATKVGFQINALYSAFVSWYSLVADFLRCKHDRELLAEWYNLSMGIPFMDRTESISINDFKPLLIDAPIAKILPDWGKYLLMSIDTQDAFFIWAIRAFGLGQKSQLIDFGYISGFDELDRIMNVKYPVENSKLSTAVQWAVIDSGGHKTEEVHRWTTTNEKTICCFGSNNPKSIPYESAKTVDEKVKSYRINSHYYKSRLNNYRKKQGQWLLNNAVDERYLEQVSSEQLIYSKKYSMNIWEPIREENHYSDVEHMLLFLADWLDIGTNIKDDKPKVEIEPTKNKLIIPQQNDFDPFFNKFNSDKPKWVGNNRSWLKR